MKVWQVRLRYHRVLDTPASKLPVIRRGVRTRSTGLAAREVMGSTSVPPPSAGQVAVVTGQGKAFAAGADIKVRPPLMKPRGFKRMDTFNMCA